MSGFYITLPSNSSNAYYPNNTKSSFRTQLAEEILLNEPHEVALVEINYSSNIKTTLGNIEIDSYFDDIFLHYESKLSIPVSINSNVDASTLLTIMNNNMNKALVYDLHIYLHNLTHHQIPRELTRKYSDSYLSKKELNEYFLEVYKTFEVNSKFILIDYEKAVFKDEFLKINSKLKYNVKLSRWEFDYTDIKLLSKKFKIRIIFAKYDIKNLDTSINDISLKHEFLQLDQEVAVNEIKYDSTDFDLKRDLNIDFKDKFLYLDYKNEQLVDFKILETPLFHILSHIDKSKTAVNLTYSYDANEFIKLTSKLSFIFGQVENFYVLKDKVHIIDNHIQAINYALIYSDIIKDQFFGDVLANILKIIPLKSSHDNEVVTFFDNLHYVPICKSKFTSINIEIRDLFGKYINFDDLFTYVIIKLHFRKLS